jgi:segregation and condensation protein B
MNEPTDATEATEATDATEGTDATDATEPTEATQAAGITTEAEAATSPATVPGERLGSILESLLFASDKPLSTRELRELVGEPDLGVVRQAIETLAVQYADRGLRLVEVAGGYQFRTAPENAAWVQKLLAVRPVRLSRAQLETLSIIAYRQPITRPEIDEIRGVDSGAVLRLLLDRTLIRILGKKEEPGRPLLYGTTKEFLEFFHLRDLGELPTLREFHELSEEHRAEVDALEDGAEAKEAAPAESYARPAATELPAIDGVEEERLLAELADAEQAAETAGAAMRPPRPAREPEPPAPPTEG